MAEIVVHCPDAGCGASYRVDSSLRGKKGRCTKCKRAFALAPAEPQPAADNVSAVWQPGEVILGLYEVKGVLGEGGMGKVYRVRHREWGIDLAVKSPRPELLTQKGAVEDFEAEAETWVHLGLHPHTASCYYVRRLGGIPRVFAECVEGGSLHDWIRKRKLYQGGPEESLKRILDIAIQFAWGLHHAHEQGLIHQDVKPHNLLMTLDETAKVTDFGLARARARAGEKSERRAGQSILVSAGGMTPAYCSPEQANGQPLSLQTDIWSWAVSVLEMFVGEVTWPSGVVAPEALQAYLDAGPAQPTLPTMPADVARLLRECLHNDPAARPRDMLQITAALRRVELQLLHPPGRPPLLKVKDYRSPPSAAKALADTLNNQAVSLLDLNRTDAAVALWEQALAKDTRHPESTYNLGLLRWRAGDLSGEGLLERLREVGGAEAGDWRFALLMAHVYLEQGNHAEAVRLLEGLPPEGAGRTEVQALLAGAREHVPQAPRQAHLLAEHVTTIWAVGLGPEGRTAVAVTGSTFYEWDTRTGEQLAARSWAGRGGLPRRSSAHPHAALSADARRVLVLDIATLELWGLDAHRQHEFHPGPGDVPGTLALDGPGGRALTAGSLGHHLTLWDLATGRQVQRFAGHKDEWITSLAFGANGLVVLSGGSPGTVKVWDVQTGHCRHSLTGAHTAEVRAIAAGEDGRRAVSADKDGLMAVWDLEAGRLLRRFRAHEKAVHALALNGDGTLLLSGGADRGVKLWELPGGRLLRSFVGHSGEVRAVSLTADGRLALSGGEDGTIRLWEVGRSVRAPLVLSRLVTSQVAKDAEFKYHQAVRIAEYRAHEKHDWHAAWEQLRVARSQPGYGRRPEALSGWRELYTRLARGTLRGAWEEKFFSLGASPVTWAAWSPAGGVLVGDGRGRLRFHRLEWAAGTKWGDVEFKGMTEAITAACVDASGRRLLAAGENGTLRRWDADTGRSRWSVSASSGPITGLALTSDGRYALVCSEEGELQVWNVAAPLCLRTVSAGRGASGQLVLLPGEEAFLTCGDGNLRLWEVASGRCLREWPELDEVFFGGDAISLDVSGDGRTLLSAAERSEMVQAWELPAGRRLRTLYQHGGGLSEEARAFGRWGCLSFDGRHALTAHRDETAFRMWDVRTGECVRRFEGHQAPVTAVCLSPDGARAVSGSEDGTVKVWWLDWELQAHEPADWDETARPYLEAFLRQHTPRAGAGWQLWLPAQEKLRRGLTRQGRPRWRDDEFERLLHTLGCAGCGWLRPEGVRRELKKMAAAWTNRTIEG